MVHAPDFPFWTLPFDAGRSLAFNVGDNALLGDLDFPIFISECGFGGVLAMRRITSSRRSAISSSL
jgi:hypothetical protein